MREGAIVEEFNVKGRKGETLHVVFRYPSRKDTKAAMQMVNAARDEAEFLGKWHHETNKTEKKFIETQIENIKKGKGVFLFVEVNGKLAGDATIAPLELDAEKHIGKFGIMLRGRFTGLGIGTRLAKKVLELAKKTTRFKMIESAYAAKNTRSKKLHAKLGFKKFGRLPKAEKLKDGLYCDRICLYKVIKKL